MLKKIAGFALLLMALPILLATEATLVSNADFARTSPAGLPLQWELRGSPGAVCRSTVDGVRMLDPKETGVLVQDGIVLEPGDYRLSVETRGFSAPAKWRVYCEWTRQEGTQILWEASPVEWQGAGKEWSEWQIVFAVPAGARPAHLAVMCEAGSDVEFRRLQLERHEQSAEKAQMGGEWSLLGKSVWTEPEYGDLSFRAEETEGALCRGIPLLPGGDYTLRFEVKGAGREDNLAEFVPFRVQLSWAGEDQSIQAPWDDTWHSSFQGKSFRFTVPEESSGVTDLEVGGGAPGVIFRNFSIEETPEAAREQAKIVLDAPVYRNTIFASLPIDTISGHVVGADGQGVRVELLAGAELMEACDGEAFTFHASGLADGEYRIRAVVGAPEVLALEVPLHKLPAAPVEVVVGADRKIYRNGEAVFPVGYWETPGGELDAYAAAQGFNLALGGQVGNEKCALEILNQVQNAGWQTMLNIGFPAQSDPESLRRWEHRLYSILTPEVLAHPALFGYYLADEPYWAGVPVKNLLAGYEMLKKIDPYHPVWINAAPRGSVEVHRVYSEAADIYGVDIYPVPYPNGHSALEDKNMTAVGAYTRRMIEATGGRKPILMTLQGFSWHSLNGSDPGIAYPSAEELRFMAFDAIVSGSSGVAYWGMRHILTPAFFDTIFAQTRELAALAPLLQEGQYSAAAVSDNPAIRVLTVTWRGKVFLIALNDRLQPERATIHAPFTQTEVKVYREGRTLPVAEGAIRDEFAPSAVHIYAEGELPEVKEDMEPSPFTKWIDGRLNATFYHGNADWIWSESGSGDDTETVLLRREFTLPEGLEAAKLWICADDFGDVTLNGQPLGAINGWTPLKEFEVKSQLRPGSNTLAVSVRNNSGPYGLLADLEMRFADGTTERLVSDTSWIDVDNRPCRVIAPYGTGVWGAKLEHPKSVQ